MSIIARNAFSASGSGGAAFGFTLYAALVGGGGDDDGSLGAASTSLSSSEMTTPLLTEARGALLDSVRLADGARVVSSSESENSNKEEDFFSTSWKTQTLITSCGRRRSSTSKQVKRNTLEGLGSDLGAALAAAGSTLTLRVSGAGLGAGFAAALLKSSFPEGFGGFEGSSLISSLTSFGSDLTLTTGLASSVFTEGAFDRPGSLFLELEAAAEDFVFAEGRLCGRSVRFCVVTQSFSLELGQGARARGS